MYLWYTYLEDVKKKKEKVGFFKKSQEQQSKLMKQKTI